MSARFLIGSIYTSVCKKRKARDLLYLEDKGWKPGGGKEEDQKRSKQKGGKRDAGRKGSGELTTGQSRSGKSSTLPSAQKKKLRGGRVDTKNEPLIYIPKDIRVAQRVNAGASGSVKTKRASGGDTV